MDFTCWGGEGIRGRGANRADDGRGELNANLSVSRNCQNH